MVIEYRLHHKYPAIRPHQFTSLAKTMQDNQKVLASREIRRSTPPVIYNASVSMNHAYALFADELYGGKTAYAAAYRGGGLKYLQSDCSTYGAVLWRSSDPATNTA